MSAHRQHYFEANAGRELRHMDGQPFLNMQMDFDRPAVWPLLAGICALTALAVVGIYHLVVVFMKPAAEATPVHTPTVQVFQLPPQDIEDARIDGFRAGMRTAAENGCGAPTLTSPISTQ